MNFFRYKHQEHKSFRIQCFFVIEETVLVSQKLATFLHEIFSFLANTVVSVTKKSSGQKTEFFSGICVVRIEARLVESAFCVISVLINKRYRQNWPI